MSELVERIRSGDTAAVARACRMIDEQAAGSAELARELFAFRGGARILGVTGSPGAGKSTLTDRLVSAFRRRAERVGVVAIDPSSPFSGGALLGDRIRMQRHAEDGEVFIRSLATRGARGGLSRSALDVVNVFQAWGANSVIVETVGVGQAELDVLGVAQTVLVVVVPGFGDDVQANKAGILEIADVFALNKADKEGADQSLHELELALALGSSKRPSIVRTVATRGDGITELVQALDRHAEWVAASAEGRKERRQRKERLFRGVLREAVADAVFEHAGADVESVIAAMVDGKLDPAAASAELISALASSEISDGRRD